MSKITVIGAGAVGATTAYTLCTHAIADEIVIIDINSQQAMEMHLISHMASLYQTSHPLFRNLCR